MQNNKQDIIFQNLNLENIKDNINKNKINFKVSNPPNQQEIQDIYNNEQYVSYYFPNVNGLNSIDENIFNIDIPKKIKNSNYDEEEQKDKKKNPIIKEDNGNMFISNILKKNSKSNNNSKNNSHKNIFFIKKEEKYKNKMKLKHKEKINNKKLLYNLCQNKKLNNSSLAFEKFIENINNENIFNKKRGSKKIKKNPYLERKIDLTNKKNKISNFEINNNNNMQLNRNKYPMTSSAFRVNPNNNKFMNFFTQRPQSQRPNVINSSIININSMHKNNNNIPNILFNDKINNNYNINNNFDNNIENNFENNYNIKNNIDNNIKNNNIIPNLMNEKESLIMAPNIVNKNEENLEKSSFVPQIFESQNSSIMIGGMEYTTLLVPKKYLGKIRARISG